MSAPDPPEDFSQLLPPRARPKTAAPPSLPLPLPPRPAFLAGSPYSGAATTGTGEPESESTEPGLTFPVDPAPRISNKGFRFVFVVVLLGAGVGVLFWAGSTGPSGAPVAGARSGPGVSPAGGGSPAEGNSRENTPGKRSDLQRSTGESSTHSHFTASRHYPAALVVAGMEDNSVRTEALEALMETWVADDPEPAAGWAGSLPAGTFRDEALSSLMFHWGARDPAAAAQWMSRTGVDDPEATSILAGRWSAIDPNAAAAWATNVPNLDSRREAIASVAGTWASRDPQSAAGWAAGLPAEEKQSAVVTVISSWARISPSTAAAWLDRLPIDSQEARATALAALVTPWTAQNPAAVSRYLNTLPEGPLREAAASQFAVTAAATAPAEALMWAMNLSDPEQRNQVVADACETWYEESQDTFRSGIGEALAFMEDPEMRRGVYAMLYERDPDFHTNLLRMADGDPTAVAPGPAPEPPRNSASTSPPPLVPPQSPAAQPGLFPENGPASPRAEAPDVSSPSLLLPSGPELPDPMEVPATDNPDSSEDAVGTDAQGEENGENIPD